MAPNGQKRRKTTTLNPPRKFTAAKQKAQRKAQQEAAQQDHLVQGIEDSVEPHEDPIEDVNKRSDNSSRANAAAELQAGPAGHRAPVAPRRARNVRFEAQTAATPTRPVTRRTRVTQKRSAPTSDADESPQRAAKRPKRGNKMPNDEEQSEQLEFEPQLEFSLSDALAISTPARPRRSTHRQEPNYEEGSASDSADDYDPNMSVVEHSMALDGLTLDSPPAEESNDNLDVEPIVPNLGADAHGPAASRVHGVVQAPSGLPEVYTKAARYGKKNKTWIDSVLVKANYLSFTDLRTRFLHELGCKATDKAEVSYKLYSSDTNHPFSEPGHMVVFCADVLRREKVLHKLNKQPVPATVWIVSAELEERAKTASTRKDKNLPSELLTGGTMYREWAGRIWTKYHRSCQKCGDAACKIDYSGGHGLTFVEIGEWATACERGIGGATLDDPPNDSPTFARFYAPDNQPARRIDTARSSKKVTGAQPDTLSIGAFAGLMEVTTRLVERMSDRQEPSEKGAGVNNDPDVSYSDGHRYPDMETFLDHLEAGEVKQWGHNGRRWGSFMAKFKEIGVLHVGEVAEWTEEQFRTHIGMQFGYASAFVKAIRSEVKRVKSESVVFVEQV